MTIIARAIGVARREGLKGIERRMRMWWARRQLERARLSEKSYVTSVYGLTLKANYNDTTFRFYVTGAYLFFFADHLAAIRRNFQLLDIGANQGLYSMLAARNPRCQAVWAFEPVPMTAAIFAENIKLNEGADKIVLVRKAISDQVGTIDIRVADGHSGKASIASGNPDPSTRTERVEMFDHVGLNDLPIRAGLPIHVKIDVEGHEGVVLQELFRSRLADEIVEIFYECDESWVDKAPLEDLLTQHGFSLNKIGKGLHYDVLATRTPSGGRKA